MMRVRQTSIWLRLCRGVICCCFCWGWVGLRSAPITTTPPVNNQSNIFLPEHASHQTNQTQVNCHEVYWTIKRKLLITFLGAFFVHRLHLNLETLHTRFEATLQNLQGNFPSLNLTFRNAPSGCATPLDFHNSDLV